MTTVANKPKVPTKKEFQVSSELRTIGEQVIKDKDFDYQGVKIEYLLVYPNISKKVAGKCVRTGKELKFFSGFDYLIEMSGEIWDALKPATQKILMQHELMHILLVDNEKTGDVDMKIRNHDVEDFASIIKEHGVDWIAEVKDTMASVYDMTPAERDSTQI